MRKTVWNVWPRLAALAAGFALAACGGGPAPEPAAPAPAQSGEEQAGAVDPAPTEPQPAAEPAPEPPPPDPAQAKAELLAQEKSAFELAEPVFKQHCAKCHVKGGKNAKAKTLGHLDMTTYPFGGHHADEITAEIRKVLAIGGGEAIMPKDDPGAVKGDELSLIAAWADAYDRAHAGGAHEDHGHDHGHGAPHDHGHHESGDKH
ncbi:MAG TPA: hypothetical protein VEL05_06960 [Candidatus Acidoferrum sp.]|nr:hypothetical protein [Candidatus Acidoferrum sp.]